MLGGNKRKGIKWERGVSRWEEERIKFFKERGCEDDIKGWRGKGDRLADY